MSFNLINMPHEILVNIAGYTGFKGCAELSRVSHLFHAICNDRLVWKQIAEDVGIKKLDPAIHPKAELMNFYKICKEEGCIQVLYAQELGPSVYLRLPEYTFLDKIPELQDLERPITKATIMLFGPASTHDAYDKIESSGFLGRFINREEGPNPIPVFFIDYKDKDHFVALLYRVTNSPPEMRTVDRKIVSLLFQKQPCCALTHIFDPNAPKQMPDGQSVIELV